MIGFAAGVMGVLIAAVLFMPINLIMQNCLHVGGLLNIEYGGTS